MYIPIHLYIFALQNKSLIDMGNIFDQIERLFSPYTPYYMQPGYELEMQKDRNKQTIPEKSFKRKLCKSCEKFPCYKDTKPKTKACEQYTKK